MVAGEFLLDLLENALLLMVLVGCGSSCGGGGGGCGGGSSSCGSAGRLFILVLTATELIFDFVFYALLSSSSLSIVLLHIF